MSHVATERWSNLPKELLLKIFETVASDDCRSLHLISQVCSQWFRIIRNDLFKNYDNFLEEAKINLRFTKLVNRNLVLKNIFTCFHLTEYEEDYLFWPRASAENMVYCSEIQGSFQIIVYDITSSFIDYVKLTDNAHSEVPVDCYNVAYQQHTDVSPFSGTVNNPVDMIKQNLYPAFRRAIYTLCLYRIDQWNEKFPKLIYRSNPVRYHLNTNKKVTYATLSQNNKYLVVAFSGLIEVYKLPPCDADASVSLNDMVPIFQKQQPSVVKFATVDNNAQVLFVKSLRLGGLSLFNIQTGDELEFPHYRLELNMSTQINDHMVILNGYDETIVYGLPQKKTSHLPKASDINAKRKVESLENIKRLKIGFDEAPIWDYYEYHVHASSEIVIPSSNVLPTDAPGCFIGLIKGYDFPSKQETAFFGGGLERSVDLVLLFDHDYYHNRSELYDKYLEDFSFDIDPEGHHLVNLEDEPCSRQTTNLSVASDDDQDPLSSQFRVVPLMFNVQQLSRSSLCSVSDDGKRFAILINNLLYVMSVSAESVAIILQKHLKDDLHPLDCLTAVQMYTDPADVRLELASPKLVSAWDPEAQNTEHPHNIFFIDDLLALPEFREQHKRFNSNSNNSNAAIDSDEEDEYDLLSDDATGSANSDVLHERARRLTSSNLEGVAARTRPLEFKPQLVWQSNDKLAINFNGNSAVLLSLEKVFS